MVILELSENGIEEVQSLSCDFYLVNQKNKKSYAGSLSNERTVNINNLILFEQSFFEIRVPFF